MTLTIRRRSEGPEVVAAMRATDFSSSWPTFMQHDPVGELYDGEVDAVADYALLATDDGEPVAKAYSTPFAFGIDGRPSCPRTGGPSDPLAA
ncbi:hypothetical protein [Flexivirga meconopsidis]|uniref:hypothetical protein n=1 Tax=Flexivirga meconopsidis TaxID=2977121 RepID=UPI00223F79D6|nr:hypothetical protein [Flexivirga meconopsidis]